jgi:4-hydroxy-4-methyl-2-oxoglutarate aldolase
VSDLVDRLRRLDTCAVSDARDRLGLSDTVVTSVKNLVNLRRVAGVVTTVRLGPVTGQIATRHLCTSAVENSDSQHVIVVDHQGRSDCAGWGGNLSRAADQRAVAGTLVYGAARDIDEAREVGYAVFATASTPRTARGRTQEHAWNEPITFDGIRVAPGDYVIADSTGIVFIPAAEVESVIAAAEMIAGTEADMARAIAQGTPVGIAMGGAYERMTDPGHKEQA